MLFKTWYSGALDKHGKVTGCRRSKGRLVADVIEDGDDARDTWVVRLKQLRLDVEKRPGKAEKQVTLFGCSKKRKR